MPRPICVVLPLQILNNSNLYSSWKVDISAMHHVTHGGHLMFTWVLILIYLQRKMRTAGEECPEKINDIVQKLGWNVADVLASVI